MTALQNKYMLTSEEQSLFSKNDKVLPMNPIVPKINQAIGSSRNNLGTIGLGEATVSFISSDFL
jgi:hypothetical protein